MNEFQLNRTDLVDAKLMDNQQIAAWTANYASDVWNNPKNHAVEIGTAAVLFAGAAVLGVRASGRVLNKFESSATGELAEVATKKLSVPANPFTRVSDRELANTVNQLKEQSGIELSSFGKTRIEGARNSEQMVLRSSNGDALKVRRGEDVVYAHKISTAGDGTTFSYYSRAPYNLKNPWIAEEHASWPLGPNGPIEGLKRSGIDILEMQKPRGFHYTADFNSLTIKWLDLKVAKNDFAEISSGGFAKGKLPFQQDYAAVKVTGPNAALTGKGEVTLISKSK